MPVLGEVVPFGVARGGGGGGRGSKRSVVGLDDSLFGLVAQSVCSLADTRTRSMLIKGRSGNVKKVGSQWPRVHGPVGETRDGGRSAECRKTAGRMLRSRQPNGEEVRLTRRRKGPAPRGGNEREKGKRRRRRTTRTELEMRESVCEGGNNTHREEEEDEKMERQQHFATGDGDEGTDSRRKRRCPG